MQSDDTPTHPLVLASANAASDGKLAERIKELSERRVPYQRMADIIRDEFGVSASRDTYRRWAVAEKLIEVPA